MSFKEDKIREKISTLLEFYFLDYPRHCYLKDNFNPDKENCTEIKELVALIDELIDEKLKKALKEQRC